MFCSFHSAAGVEYLAPSVTGQRTGHDAVAHGLVSGRPHTEMGSATSPVAAVVLIRSTARLIAA